MKLINLYVNKSSGSLIRVDRVDASFCTYSVLAPDPSKFMMPVKEYDTEFVKYWRPATDEDLEALNNSPRIRLPANAPSEWA
jgi:hypothetical protein